MNNYRDNLILEKLLFFVIFMTHESRIMNGLSTNYLLTIYLLSFSSNPFNLNGFQSFTDPVLILVHWGRRTEILSVGKVT